MPERWWRSPVVLALLAFAVLRLAALTRYPAWTDETWTMAGGNAAFAIGIALLPAVLTSWSLVRGTAKPRYDLAVAAVPAVGNVVLYTAPTVDVRPLEWAARGTGVTIRVPGDSVPTSAEHGWLVWNDRRPAVGFNPPAALVRRGFTLGAVVSIPSDEDRLVVLPFLPRTGQRSP